MNTPVNFELAKLLKEKDFDEYCSFIWNEENLEEPYYYSENYEMICQRIHYYGDIPMVNNSYIEKYATYVEKDEITEEVYDLIAAPTIGEVVMWLYEKHSLWILALPTITGYFAYKIVDVQLNPEKPIERPPYSDVSAHDYNSPVQTYEAAIEYTLTNLI